MNNFRLLFICSLILTLIFTNAASAQKERVPFRAYTFSNQPFDTSVDTLPPYYRGHSFVEIVMNLLARREQFEKDEFETTADYNERLEKLAAKPLAGSLGLNYLFAFSVPVSSTEESKLTFSYDADAAQATFNLSFSAIELARASKTIGHYVSKTAFNRTTRVSAIRYDSIYLQIDTASARKWTDGYNAILSVKTRTDYARSLKSNLRALMLIRLIPKYVDYAFERSPPTINEPTDDYEHKYTLKAELQAVWFYNFIDGKVLGKLDNTTARDEYALDQSNRGIRAIDLRRAPSPMIPNIVVTPVPRPTPIPVDTSRTYSGRDVTSRAVITAKPEPQYTEEARANQVQGTITLRIELLANGTVGIVEPIASLPHGLTENAIKAARGIRFRPATINGVAVSQWIQSEYNFNLY